MYVIQKKVKCEHVKDGIDGFAGPMAQTQWSACKFCNGTDYIYEEVDLLEVLKKISVNISVGGNLGVVQFPFKGIEINE